ncbi:hypothetical protein ACGFNU_35670 [Spirillospora sp. NPDC048911]|uniref:hypothetical protein n=1 Tax=Spirillospora sp. NPDC048911 TaxID=3364527 RepID=UPI003712EAEA
MEKVMGVIEEWRRRIDDHPLHKWLVDEDDGVEPEQKLWFALYFTNFIMYFRELNIYHISYEARPGLISGTGGHGDADGLRKKAISAHAGEDMTHSRLFMRDFRTLGWDELLGWRPSEVLHWLFSSEVNEQLRRRTTAITKLYVEAADPAVKYAVVEAVEACGHGLFRHTCRLADRYTERTGKELIYWGQFHLARETGHAVEEYDEGEFEGLELTPEQRETAIGLAVRAFELIDEQNSHMLQLAQETISQGGFAERRRLHAAPVTTVPAKERDMAGWDRSQFWPEPYEFHFWPVNAHPSQQPVVEALRRSDRAVRKSGILDLLQTQDVEEGLGLLRLALMFIAADTCGTPTVYRYMVPYAYPNTPEERAVNRIARQFGRRAHMLYADWESLGINERLGWPVSRTLEFVYLDAATESHRDLRAVVTHHIDATTDPILRYWTMVGLKKMTATYADGTGDLARRVEAATGLDLPYLTLKQNPDKVVLEPDPVADAVRFEEQEIDAATAARAAALVEDIAEAIRVRYLKMVDSIRERHYPEVA